MSNKATWLSKCKEIGGRGEFPLNFGCTSQKGLLGDLRKWWWKSAFRGVCKLTDRPLFLLTSLASLGPRHPCLLIKVQVLSPAFILVRRKEGWGLLCLAAWMALSKVRSTALSSKSAAENVCVNPASLEPHPRTNSPWADLFGFLRDFLVSQKWMWPRAGQ